MNQLTNSSRNASGDRASPEWQQFPADAYLDHRHRNWVISEELGDVQFVSDAGVVLVHRERAEHIARALLRGPRGVVLEQVLAMPARTPSKALRLPAPPTGCHAPEVEVPAVVSKSGWHDILGALGIVAGAAVFVAALALSLDDAAPVVALTLVMRGGRLILDIDS